MDLFYSHGFALSQPDIEKLLSPLIDRVTIYRTLSLFVENGILHKVLDDSGTMKYALCPEECNDHKHFHDHVHFKCTICSQTSCLENLEIPGFTLPKGYELTESNLLLSGVCPGCSGKG